MPQAKRRVTFSGPPDGVGVSQAWGVETWTVSPSTESAKTQLKTWTSQEIQESTNLMGVTITMPEKHAILDCGAALDCVGEVAAALAAQAITAFGETRRPAVVDKIQRFNLGSDGDPVEASFAVTLPVQLGDATTWIEAFVVPGSTPHLISRRWLSQHRCLVNVVGKPTIWFGSPCASLIWSPASVTCESIEHSGSAHCNDRLSQFFLKCCEKCSEAR